MDIDNKLLVDLVDVILLVITSAIGRYLVPLVKTKLGQEKLQLLSQYAVKFVKLAEVMIDGEKKGDEKREYVSELIVEEANKLHLKLTDDQIRMLIEDAVFSLNNKKE
jgi:LL-H family phage holin